jgi:signal transduction histidine kinase
MPLRPIVTRLRHPQTTVRWRLTLLYGGLFLVCGAVLLAINYTLAAHATTVDGPRVFARAVRAPANLALRPPVTISGNLHQAITAKDSSIFPPGALPAQFEKLLASDKGRRAVNYVVASQRGADLNRLEIESAIALAIMAIVSALLGWLVAGRVLRPLRTMTATTQEISEASLHRRLAMRGPRDELRQLADTIDGLLTRLESAFDAQRRFVANASHELRTPLTAARALLEMVLSDRGATLETYREACRQVLEEGEQQERLIDALLALAQGQQGIHRREAVDLGAMTRQVLDAHEAEAVARGVHLEVSLAPAYVSGDAALIQRLVDNLVTNAIVHNVVSGTVRVGVDGRGALGTRLEIENTGPVIAPDQIGSLLQPFRRLTPDRVGSHDGLGLGLSIVAAIAEAHDAALRVEARRGGGLSVSVQFPPQPDGTPPAPASGRDELTASAA